MRQREPILTISFCTLLPFQKQKRQTHKQNKLVKKKTPVFVVFWLITKETVRHLVLKVREADLVSFLKTGVYLW